MAIKNKLSEKLLSSIPHGKSKTCRAERKRIIMSELSKYRDKTFRNPCLSAGILCSGKSIAEIAHHASGDYESTIAALHLKYAINNARIVYLGLPKDGKQIDHFKSWITIVMRCEIEGIGQSKLTVVDSLENGNKGELDLVAYCLTKEKGAKLQA